LPPPGRSRRPRESLSLSLSRGMNGLTKVQNNGDTRAVSGAISRKAEIPLLLKAHLLAGFFR
jgi:hypothetical protein